MSIWDIKNFENFLILDPPNTYFFCRSTPLRKTEHTARPGRRNNPNNAPKLAAMAARPKPTLHTLNTALPQPHPRRRRWGSPGQIEGGGVNPSNKAKTHQ